MGLLGYFIICCYNIAINQSMYISIFVGKSLRNGITVSKGMYIFIILIHIAKFPSIEIVLIYTLIGRFLGFVFPHSTANSTLSNLWNCQSKIQKWYLRVVLICIFTVMEDTELPLMGHKHIYVFFLYHAFIFLLGYCVFSYLFPGVYSFFFLILFLNFT